MDMDGIVEMASAAPDALIPNSAPLASPSEAAAAAVDVTLDVRNDAVAVHGDSARPATGAAVGVDDSGAPARTEGNGFKFISLPDGDADWPAVEKRFDMLSQSGRLHRSAFGNCIGIREAEFAGDLFDGLARRRNITGDSISRAQLREFWEQISDSSFNSRLQTFFDMVVKNADGRITESELREIITLSASTNKMLQIEQQAEEYARLIMKELDPSNLGYIAIEDLEIRLPQPPRQKKLSGQSGLLSSMAEPSNPLGRWYRRAKHLIDDNWKRLWVILLWISTCVGLFTWKFLQYRRRRHVFEVMGYCICAAEGGAETLKFNLALVLLPVCRNTITWLRTHTTLVAHVMPLDDSINFHSLVAAGIAVGAGIHAISHLACGFPRLLHATDANSYWWLVTRSTEGWTGMVMVVLMVVAFTLAMPWFRRGRVRLPGPLRRLSGYNAFWYSHHCFVLVYALLVVHGHYGRLYLTNTSSRWYNRSTWMYLAVPMLLYACERFARVLRSTVLLPVKILEVVLYPGNMLSLHFSKPQGFQYKSGQYIFINCPAISLFQWHPFCITSAPQDNYVSVHIRALGDWTREVKNIFLRDCRPPMEGRSGLLRAEYNCDGDTMLNPSFPKLLIDGPYGLTAQDYEKYDVVLLISLGIGVGGMISIIKDIINNLKQFDGDLESGDTRKNYVPSSFRTRRAYFYWLTRDQGSFEWFHNVMDEVVQMDKKGVIELHNYCTSLYDEGDARSALITMLQSLNFAKNGIDIISGTRVKTHFGRPKWSNVYKRIALNHRDQCVGVFYCGAPVLEEQLRDVARDFSRKTTTKFEFHKENF